MQDKILGIGSRIDHPEYGKGVVTNVTSSLYWVTFIDKGLETIPVDDEFELIELAEDEVSALTVVAMSGSVAEAMEFGKAGGANADLMELQNVFRQSANFLGAEKQQDLTRWGALTSYRLITANKDKLDKLCDAFSAQKPIADCVTILES